MVAVKREELRGWYHIIRRFVENEVGQRFYFDFYGAKWLAFANGPGNMNVPPSLTRANLMIVLQGPENVSSRWT